MRTVIVTAIGSFSADIVIKKCRENGIRVIGCDVYPREWIADAGNVEAFYQVPYATDTRPLYRDHDVPLPEGRGGGRHSPDGRGD